MSSPFYYHILTAPVNTIPFYIVTTIRAPAAHHRITITPPSIHSTSALPSPLRHHKNKRPPPLSQEWPEQENTNSAHHRRYGVPPPSNPP